MSMDALTELYKQKGGTISKSGYISCFHQDPEVEYRAVRQGLGIFDYSHQNVFYLKGDGAGAFLHKMVTGNVEFLEFCHILFTSLLDENGKIMDLLYIFRTIDGFLIIGSTEQKEKVLQIFRQHLPADVELIDENGKYAIIALEGVYSWELAKTVAGSDIVGLRYLSFLETSFQNIPQMICARCGITGEYGFRFIIPIEYGVDFIKFLSEQPSEHPREFCGQDILNVLSQEVRFPVFGQGIHEGGNPIELGLNWMIDIKKEEYQGKENVQGFLDGDAKRRMVGFLSTIKSDGLKTGQPVFIEDEKIGELVMNAYSFTLDNTIGYIYLDQEWACVGIKDYAIHTEREQIPIQTVSTAFFLTESIRVQMF